MSEITPRSSSPINFEKFQRDKPIPIGFSFLSSSKDNYDDLLQQTGDSTRSLLNPTINKTNEYPHVHDNDILQDDGKRDNSPDEVVYHNSSLIEDIEEGKDFSRY